MSAVRNLTDRLAATARSSTAAAWAELQSNPRVRLGLAALGFVLISGLMLRVYNDAMVKRAEIGELTRDAQKLDQVNGRAAQGWIAAQSKAEKLLAESVGRLWSRGDPGVAHADFYNWVVTTAATAGLPKATARIVELRKPSADSALLEMRVSLAVSTGPAAPVDREAIYRFLRLAADSPRLILVRSLRVRFQPTAVLECELAAFVEPPVEPAKGSQPDRRQPEGQR